VADSLGGAESVCSVARRHGPTSQQLFTWRRDLRQKALAREAPAEQLFVPAVSLHATTDALLGYAQASDELDYNPAKDLL
jgi:transposase